MAVRVTDECVIIIFWSCTLMSCCECNWSDYSWLCNGERWADVLMCVFCRNWLVTRQMRTASLTCWVSFRAAVWMTSAVSWTSRPMERTLEERIQTHSMTWSVSHTVSLDAQEISLFLKGRDHTAITYSSHVISNKYDYGYILKNIPAALFTYSESCWFRIQINANNETAFVNIRSVFHC